MVSHLWFAFFGLPLCVILCYAAQPLGKLKKETVARGMACLEACEAQLANLKAGPDAASGSAKARMLIQDKSNQFYTLIPHDFGDDRAPPLLDCAASIQEKYDLLAALGDMEVAANILKNDKKQSDTLTHNYRQLDTDLELVNPASQEFKVWRRACGIACGACVAYPEAYPEAPEL